MKKKKLKRWVQVLLTIIAMASVVVIASDSDDLITFLIVHVVATLTLLGSATLLFKYGE